MGNVIVSVFHPFTSASGVCNILLHVSLIAFFIAIFFFTYGSLAEGAIVQNQCKDIVESLTGGLNGILTSQQLCMIRRKLQSSPSSGNVSDADKEACQKNRNIKSGALKIVGGVLGGVVGLIIILWLIGHFGKSQLPRSGWSVGHIISNMIGLTGSQIANLLIVNIIVVIFVAFTEYSFLTFVVMNYKSADPNFVKRELIQALITYGNTD